MKLRSACIEERDSLLNFVLLGCERDGPDDSPWQGFVLQYALHGPQRGQAISGCVAQKPFNETRIDVRVVEKRSGFVDGPMGEIGSSHDTL